ncbi:DNA-dependent protein kinase catalytic subunit [Calliopsis andreniformis]|uniref:DNA-dependent protein kinase catalytic subunit n=1 Tax=Calliopsis andreniformis TaxID=337506 RepID=UPI003FCE22CC
MDSFKNFMDSFEGAIKDRNSNNLIQILEYRNIFKNVTKNDIELILSILFDKRKGLLWFLNNELKKSISQKGFDQAIAKAFNFIKNIIEEVYQFYVFEPYIVDTKNTCEQALAIHCSGNIRRAACDALNKLIELYKTSVIGLGETIKHFVSLFHAMNEKERKLVLSVIGTIAKYNPQIPEVHEYSNIIFLQLRNDFIKQYKPNIAKNKSPDDTLHVYFDVLSNILKELPNEIKIKYCKELYGWIKVFSPFENYKKKRSPMTSAINLLFYHTHEFYEFIYNDHNFWYTLLKNLSNEKNPYYSTCAQHALKRFYQTIGNTLKHKTSEEDKAIFLHYKNLLEELLKTNQQNSVILYGFSQMAAPCKQYFPNNVVRDMFSLITHYAMSLCFREDLERVDLNSIYDYQEALSEIIVHISDLFIDDINIILKLSVLLIKKFPDLVTNKGDAINSLTNTIINIGLANKTLLEEYLYNLIHDGITWSCSHTLFIDAELQRELTNLKKRPVCYKDYVDLWTQVLNSKKYGKYRETVQEVADSMINVCIILISKLNLNTKMKEDNVFSDAALSQIAENEADFRTFINIVDLYVDLLNKVESSLLINTMHKFLLTIISISYKYPLISGFYRLVHATFKHIFNLTKDEIEIETLKLLYKYLHNLLCLISTFSGELLTTCLHLILSMPETYVEPILENTVPAFKIAFTMGLSEFEIAYTTLNALEKWTNYLNSQNMNKVLQEIVPFLDPYLQSKESFIELLQNVQKPNSKVSKHIVFIDDEKTLERFQIRVLLFIASLDTDIIMNFIQKTSMDTGATWDKKDLLKYSLEFPDIEIDIHFDKIIPRLILLAQNSGDRRTKIIACEVLHAMVAYVLGKTSKCDPNRFIPIYTMLCPALLNLGCDFDEVARKIFQPLMLQLTHWLSSKFMIKSSASVYFIDAFFNGLCHDSNSSLREFSGMCLAEFSQWSIKQSSNDRETRLNIEEVIYKMTNFALHPSISKRVAAATAFNHLYRILREDEEIVSVYWLEILYCFIKSLDGCNDPSIIIALDHVEKVIIAKQDLLNMKYYNRRKPHEFEDATLIDAVNWLFTQCGCLDQCCRTKSMELVIKLSKYIPNCDSAEKVINNYIDIHGFDKFKHIILKNLNSKIDCLSRDNMLLLLRSFDCFIWIIRNDLLNIYYLFTNLNSDKEVMFNGIRNFIDVVNNIKIIEKEDLVISSKESEDLQTLKCKVITTMFDFVQILLNFDENFIPDFFFHNNLFELISKCIMYPQIVGFDMKNLKFTEVLSSVMGNLLQAAMRKNGHTLLNCIKDKLSVHVEKYKNDFIDLGKVVNGTNTCNDLKVYVQGLIFLEQHNILSQLHDAPQLLEQSENYITRIFNVLAMERIGELVCRNIKPSAKYYLQMLMKLLLLHYEPSITRTLLKLIQIDTMLGPSIKKIEHGIHFLNMFKDEIFRYMLNEIEETMDMLNDLLQGNQSLLLLIVEQLFLFVQRHKKEFYNCTELLVYTVIKRFTIFERAVNNLPDRKQKLITIYGIAVHLKQNPTELLSLSEDFYIWILNELTESTDIEYKVQILRNFLICLIDSTCNSRPELLVILRNLRNCRHHINSTDFSRKTIEALKIINCFQTLITLLPVTKSVVIFETIILFAVGIAKHLCNERTNEYMQKYFNLISTECVLESIEKAYKLFMNWNLATNERFDILYKFLLPVFQFCKTTEIHKFFEKNIKDIYTIIRQSLIGSIPDIKQLIISKIGCYDLVSIMFAKIDIREINDVNSTITRNAIDNVITGKELLQDLYSSALNVRALKTSEGEHKEIMRLLHCSAYNCSIAIVCLKEDEESYTSLFAENRKKGQLIWENIVDCQKQYNFQQTFEKYPKYYKKLINIRKSKQKQISRRYSYIHSYDLATSTLQEDLNAYDFNEAIVSNKSHNDKEESMSLTFEIDELINHECMTTICGALYHMISTNISMPPTGDNIVMPQWLKSFRSSIMLTRHNNIRLFMLKIVWNMQTAFKPYAKLFLEPVMHAINSYLKTSQLNYIITDVLEMLMDWQIVPDQRTEKVLAQELWETIICKALIKINAIPKQLYKYYKEIVNRLLEMWHTCLKLPQNLNDKMKEAPEAAVYLILICFVNRMENDIVQRNDILEFLEKSLEMWQGDEEIVSQCCRCFGLILKFIDNDIQQVQRKYTIIDKIRTTLKQMLGQHNKRLMKYVHELCRNYPIAAMIYFEFVAASILKVDEEGKLKGLEIFLLCIPNFTVDKILKELDHIKFHGLLKDKILPFKKVTLQITNSLVSVLPAVNLLSLIDLVPPYTKDENPEYRENAYDIFMNIHKKYISDISEDESIKQLMEISKQILLNGILDSDEQLQEKILNYWTQNAQLSCTYKDRLLEILNIYNPTVGNNFLPFLLLVILDLTKKSKNYTQKIFEPLHSCSYRDYNIPVSWRIQHFGSKTPLFVQSLASQVYQTFTQMNTTSSNVYSDLTYTMPSTSFTNVSGVKETQEPEFETTYGNEEYNSKFKISKIPQPAYNKKSKRILSSSNEESTFMREKRSKENKQHDDMIKEERPRQRSTVKLYRKYRIGDFPDIEISPATLIEPLQQLIKKDHLICKDLTVSIICTLIKECRHDHFVGEVANNLKHIIEDQQGTNSSIAAILEIMLTTRITDCSPEIIAKVSKSNSLNFLGSLVLEESLIYDTRDFQPPVKKARNNDVSDISNKWLQLTNLYESMNDIDVVLSIFQNHITHEDMREAAFAQSANNWVRAKTAYEKAYETESELIKEHCLQGLFECLSNLCCWSEIDKYIDKKLNENINNIWSNSWKDWMFPWLFEVQVRKIVEGDFVDKVNENQEIINSWFKDEVKIKYVRRFCGAEAPIIFLKRENIQQIFKFLLDSQNDIREEWIKIHPLSTQLRVQKLQNLRIMNDVYEFIKVFKIIKKQPLILQDIFKLYNKSVPSAQDAILPWDKLISYRIHFISLLNAEVEKWNKNDTQNESESVPDEEEIGFTRKFYTTAFNMQLKMVEAALNQKNKYIASKYLMQLEQNPGIDSPDLEHQFILAGARIKYLKGEIHLNIQQKLNKYYTTSWRCCHDLLQKNNLSPMMNISIRQQISKLVSKIVELSEEDETFCELLRRNTTILKEINVETTDDPSIIRNSLTVYGLNHLQTCCKITVPNINECFFSLSMYCYDKLSRNTNDIQLYKEFVNSTLKAMSYGSLEAAHYFPCLLKSEYFENEEVKDIFVNECKKVQTWLFLSWQAQLFSHLGTPIAELIIPILERIITDYPNAVIYTFRLTVETNPALLNETKTYKIRQMLYNRPEIDRFLLALQYVVQPELYLQYYLSELIKNLSQGVSTAIDTFLNKVYSNTRENKNDPKPGSIFNQIAAYKSKVKDLEHERPEKIKQEVCQMIQHIRESLSRRKDKLKLKDYSPWLHEFSERDIEIPGQYSGDGKPMPQYHAKIIKLEPNVKVMQSLRKPIRITMVGNDAKEYHFLVKFGEDLRQDQRLQQLFTLMNKTLCIDTACKQRQLSIDTYQVIPLSRIVGIIQWVNNTRSLQELIYYTLNKEETKRYDSVLEKYNKWIQIAVPSKRIHEAYKEATMKYSASKVITKMNEFISHTEWDSLRKTFKVLCPSVESFVSMRRNFTITYATMCIAHWIVGIGDRHLGNTLVTIGSGRCLGIDFGLAFDAGIDQKVPELMPFRLTNQILGLLKPFTEKDLLGVTMVHVLRALRNDQGPILSCMDVFVNEPLNWTEHVNKALREGGEEIADVKWIPMKKIKAVTKKLNGIKPSLITVEQLREQLKEQHSDKYFDRYYAIIIGNDDVKQARVLIEDNCLSPEKQVECLLDQATDLNILGRSYVGWKPWL